MKNVIYPALLAPTLTSAGCYHASVTTGAPMGTQTIEEPWALSFVAGLIPPKAVDASSCPNGVAMVETEHSFLNQLVAALTGGIVTPMSITVTCAAAGTSSIESAEEIRVSEGSNQTEILDAINEAALQAADSDSPVLVRFE